MKYAWIFDMDGVLIDSQQLHYQADRRTLAQFGVNATQKEVEAFAGTANAERFTIYREQFDIAANVEEMVNYRDGVIRQLFWESGIQPIAGVQALLEEICGLGYPLALASSTDRPMIEWILETTGLRSYFRVVVSGEEVSRSKPAPDVFLEVANKLRMSPSSCFVVEDSVHGIRAAKAAGMWVLGYRNPGSGRQDLSEADLQTDDFGKISVRTFIRNKEE